MIRFALLVTVVVGFMSSSLQAGLTMSYTSTADANYHFNGNSVGFLRENGAIVSAQNSADIGTMTARIITGSTVDSIDLTYRQLAPYTYEATVTILGRAARPDSPNFDYIKPFSYSAMTPSLFSGTVGLSHISDRSGDLDVATVTLNLPTCLVLNGPVSTIENVLGDVSTVFHFNFQGPASGLTSQNVNLQRSSVPEPASMSLIALGVFASTVRRPKQQAPVTVAKPNQK